jgi:flavin reductase (DIM6/NTAB) family NADH-FMN oxidoreductase RutF
LPPSLPPEVPDFDSICKVFALVDREVWIVTSADGERQGGLVATWVFQAALDPQRPVVAAAIAPIHNTAQIIGASGSFALHLIDPSQIDIAWRFGLSSGRDQNKLEGLTVTTARTGAPILQDSIAWLDCRVLTTTDIGDRILFWGEVVAGQATGTGPVLCERALFAAATSEQRSRLKENLSRDIDELGPLHEQWRNTLKSS